MSESELTCDWVDSAARYYPLKIPNARDVLKLFVVTFNRTERLKVNATQRYGMMG